MAGYSGVDFIDFDSQLNDEEKLVRQTARQFVENEIIPSSKSTAARELPRHLVLNSANSAFSARVFMAMAVPACPTSLTVGHPGTRTRRLWSAQLVSVQSALVMYPIYTYGSDAQKTNGCPFYSKAPPSGASPYRAAIRLQSRRHADPRR